MFQKYMIKQLYDYFEDIICPSQCGFRKRCNTQHCLLVMLEKSNKFMDKGSGFGALLTELAKAFECIDHKLVIAKLFCYGVSSSSLSLIFF